MACEASSLVVIFILVAAKSECHAGTRIFSEHGTKRKSSRVGLFVRTVATTWNQLFGISVPKNA